MSTSSRGPGVTHRRTLGPPEITGGRPTLPSWGTAAERPLPGRSEDTRGRIIYVYNHAPPDYQCPFCRNIATGRGDFPVHILARYPEVVVKLNPRWWPANPGGALVVPIEHYENLYDLPPRLGAPIQEAARDTALAMKAAFGCHGVSTRQHNEPAGNQDVWHYHLHVFPRYEGDHLYASRPSWAEPTEMALRAHQLRAAWPTR